MLTGKKRSLSADSDNCALHKEWDEALCPVCMEHPHNAVLLLCSSHDKGCRPYICDTSYRHSNCLDRYRKLKTGSSDPSLVNSGNTSAPISAEQDEDNLTEVMQDPRGESLSELNCPLCRGHVHGWKVIEDARKHLNSKTRNCSRESCSFVGNYSELRRHARSLHPSARPAEIDPSRQRAWRRFENQREYADIVSAIQSAIPGAVMFGDYVIENGNNNRISTERGRASGDVNEPLWTTFVLFEMLESMEPRNRPRRTWSRHRRSSGRRYLWGENLLGTRNQSDDNNEGERNMSNANNDNLPARTRRRRLTRTRFSTDRP